MEFYENEQLEQEKVLALFSLRHTQKITEESLRAIDKNTLRSLLKNPVKNVHKLQEVSWNLFYTSGEYRRRIGYLSSLLTFDYVPFPIRKTSKKQFDNMNEDLRKMNVKFNLKWMLFYLILLGEVYIYENSNIFMLIPNEICRIVEVENGIYKFAVDLNKIQKKMLDILPKDIVNACQHKQSYDKSEYGKGMYFVKNGFALNPIYGKSNGVPFLLSGFDDVLSLSDSKDATNNSQIAESLKLIHQKVPLGNDNKPVMDRDRTKAYHNDTKKVIPENIGVSTSPLELNMMSFVDSQNREKYYLSMAKENVSDSFGISSMLFNDAGSSGEALKKSIMVDELWMYDLLPMFENIVNKKIEKYGFAIQFLRSTYNNKWEQAKNYQATLSVGGSSLAFMSYCGFEPYQSIKLLEFERDVLDIDSLISPKKTSYTMTGEETVKENGELKESGRNKSEDITDSTEKARESE